MGWETTLAVLERKSFKICPQTFMELNQRSMTQSILNIPKYLGSKRTTSNWREKEENRPECKFGHNPGRSIRRGCRAGSRSPGTTGPRCPQDGRGSGPAGPEQRSLRLTDAGAGRKGGLHGLQLETREVTWGSAGDVSEERPTWPQGTGPWSLQGREERTRGRTVSRTWPHRAALVRKGGGAGAETDALSVPKRSGHACIEGQGGPALRAPARPRGHARPPACAPSPRPRPPAWPRRWPRVSLCADPIPF